MSRSDTSLHVVQRQVRPEARAYATTPVELAFVNSAGEHGGNQVKAGLPLACFPPGRHGRLNAPNRVGGVVSGAIFDRTSQLDSGEAKCFQTVLVRLGHDRRNSAPWVPKANYYGGEFDTHAKLCSRPIPEDAPTAPPSRASAASGAPTSRFNGTTDSSPEHCAKAGLVTRIRMETARGGV